MLRTPKAPQALGPWMEDDSAPLRPASEVAAWQASGSSPQRGAQSLPPDVRSGAQAGSHEERHMGGWDQATPGTHPPTKPHTLQAGTAAMGPKDARHREGRQTTKDWQTQRRQGQGRSWYPKTTA